MAQTYGPRVCVSFCKSSIPVINPDFSFLNDVNGDRHASNEYDNSHRANSSKQNNPRARKPRVTIFFLVNPLQYKNYKLQIWKSNKTTAFNDKLLHSEKKMFFRILTNLSRKTFCRGLYYKLDIGQYSYHKNHFLGREPVSNQSN